MPNTKPPFNSRDVRPPVCLSSLRKTYSYPGHL